MEIQRHFNVGKREVITVEQAKQEIQECLASAGQGAVLNGVAGVVLYGLRFARVYLVGRSRESKYYLDRFFVGKPENVWRYPKTIREALQNLYDDATGVDEAMEILVNAIGPYLEACRELGVDEDILAKHEKDVPVLLEQDE